LRILQLREALPQDDMLLREVQQHPLREHTPGT
jgi:hypothetical protein